MSYDLSFTEEFFTGSEETTVTDYPTSILEAIENLTDDEKMDIAVNVMKSDCPLLYIMSESFAWDVLEKVRETNTCDDLRSPITVYIDEDGDYSVTVYEKQWDHN